MSSLLSSVELPASYMFYFIFALCEIEIIMSLLKAFAVVIIVFYFIGSVFSELIWSSNPSAVNKVHEPLDADSLTTLRDSVDHIIVFIQPNDVNITIDNYPKFRRLLQSSKVLKLKEHLHIDWSLWNNTQVVRLNNSMSDQDTELVETFSKLVSQHGGHRVLGILQASQEHGEHRRERCYPREKHWTFDYRDEGNIILKATDAILNISSGSHKLTDNFFVISGPEDKLIVNFMLKKFEQVTLSFLFQQNGHNWSMEGVVFNSSIGQHFLKIDGKVPAAPIGEFYECAEKILFRKSGIVLSLGAIQVQPYLRGQTAFSEKGVYCFRLLRTIVHAVGWTLAVLFIGTIIGLLIQKKMRSAPAKKPKP